MISLEKKHKQAIDSFLLRYPYVIYAYGSRTKGVANPHSDLELCIFDQVDFKGLAEIKEGLNNLLLPFSIDVVVWPRLSQEFKEIIEPDLVRYIPDPFLGAQVIDVTCPLSAAAPVWPGGSFTIKTVEDYKDHKFLVQQYEFSASLGTHIDLPAHMIAQGLDSMSLTVPLIAPCSILYGPPSIQSNFEITAEVIQTYEKKFGSLVPHSWLVCMTGWGEKVKNLAEYLNKDNDGMMQFPIMTPDAAEYLVTKNIIGITIDTLSPDRNDKIFAVHKILLENDILILENIRYIPGLKENGGFIQVAPLKIQGGTEVPVKAFIIQQPMI